MTDHELKTIETIKIEMLCANDCPSYHKDYDLGLCTCYKHHTIVTVTHAFNDRAELQTELLKWQGHCAGIEATLKIFEDETFSLQNRVKELREQVVELQSQKNN